MQWLSNVVILALFGTGHWKAAYKETGKGITSHELRTKYPALKKLRSLWTRSYFAATSGTVSAETIQRYIEVQKGL